MDLFRLFSVPFKVYKDHMLFVRVCADLNPNTSVSLFFFFFVTKTFVLCCLYVL